MKGVLILQETKVLEKYIYVPDLSEDTIVFYKKIGCVSAKQIVEELFAEDPNDIQLEYYDIT